MTGSVRRARLIGAALQVAALSLGILGWELGLYYFETKTLGRAALKSGLVDLAILLPVITAALWASGRASSRLGFGSSLQTALAARAGLFGIAFLALMAPAATLRIHAASVWLAVEPGVAGPGGGAFLCASGGAPGQGVLALTFEEAVRQGVRSALILDAAALPLVFLVLVWAAWRAGTIRIPRWVQAVR